MIRPDGFYGVSKAFGEAIGSYYNDYHDVGFDPSPHWMGNLDRRSDILALRFIAMAEPPRRTAQIVRLCRSMLLTDLSLRHLLRDFGQQVEDLRYKPGQRRSWVMPLKTAREASLLKARHRSGISNSSNSISVFGRLLLDQYLISASPNAASCPESHAILATTLRATPEAATL